MEESQESQPGSVEPFVQESYKSRMNLSKLTPEEKLERIRLLSNERSRRAKLRKKAGIVSDKTIQKREARIAWKARHDTENQFKVTYKPQDHQKRFRELLDSGKRIVLMLGGIRSGKTFAGAREALRQIYVHTPNKGIGWIVSPTYPMSLVVEREFEDACQTKSGSLILKHYKNDRAYILYPHKKSQKPYRVEIKSAEHPDRLRGASLDWIWMDEAAMMSEETWKILLGRVLDSKGTIFLTTTPKGRNWIYREIFQRSLNDPRIGIVKAVTTDNIYLDKEDVEHLRSGYSNQFAQQELAAEFVNFEGLVYHSFRWEENTCPPILQIPAKAEVLGGIDFGLHDPTVHLWVMKFNGKYYVVDEYYCKDRTLEDHARGIKSSYWDQFVMRRWADPSGGQERLEFDKFGIGSYEAKNDIRPGINAVQRLFEDGRLVIARNCLKTLEEIGVYQYKSKEGRNSFDEPVDYSNHTMDALRYVIYSEEGFSKAHPFVTLDERGNVRVHGSDGNPTSGKLDDWIHARALPLGAIEDSDENWLE